MIIAKASWFTVLHLLVQPLAVVVHFCIRKDADSIHRGLNDFGSLGARFPPTPPNFTVDDVFP